jgi:transcriptional regulator with XRE-family HTH domain
MSDLHAQAEEYRQMSDTLDDMLKRIERRRRLLGMSERAAALRAGLSPSQIRTMRRQHLEGKQHGASVRTIARLAKSLQTTPEWLMSGAGQEQTATDEASQTTSPASGLRLMGAVGAGAWLEDITEDHDARYVQVPVDPRYPAQYQSTYEIRGSSTDRFARPGDFLIVVDRKAAGLPLRSGDIVIVIQNKSDLREVTARRYKLNALGCELCFESNDPRYRHCVQLPAAEGNDFVMLGGVVVGVYRPLC